MKYRKHIVPPAYIIIFFVSVLALFLAYIAGVALAGTPFDSIAALFFPPYAWWITLVEIIEMLYG